MIDPKKIAEDIIEIDDLIRVVYYSFSDQQRRVLNIRLYTRLIHGSIGYLKNDVMLYRPSSNSSFSFVPSNQCHRIRLINRFSTTVVLFKVTTKFDSILSNHVQVGKRKCISCQKSTTYCFFNNSQGEFDIELD